MTEANATMKLEFYLNVTIPETGETETIRILGQDISEFATNAFLAGWKFSNKFPDWRPKGMSAK